jgi:hypothetical protein
MALGVSRAAYKKKGKMLDGKEATGHVMGSYQYSGDRRHPYIMGLFYSPLCKGCDAKEETSAHVLCECDVLASLRHTHLWVFFLSQMTLEV